ncbi:hypothetical protein BDC45DRAFT_537845 [Circinella umbellata]|nr:hypothetical protein BDC45DRAFT_537845 [Circinella umbellata]
MILRLKSKCNKKGVKNLCNGGFKLGKIYHKPTLMGFNKNVVRNTANDNKYATTWKDRKWPFYSILKDFSLFSLNKTGLSTNPFMAPLVELYSQLASTYLELGSMDKNISWHLGSFSPRDILGFSFLIFKLWTSNASMVESEYECESSSHHIKADDQRHLYISQVISKRTSPVLLWVMEE